MDVIGFFLPQKLPLNTFYVAKHLPKTAEAIVDAADANIRVQQPTTHRFASCIVHHCCRWIPLNRGVVPCELTVRME